MTDGERQLVEKWAARTPVTTFSDSFRWFFLSTLAFSACVALSAGASYIHPIFGLVSVIVTGPGGVLCLYAALSVVFSYRDEQAYHRDFLLTTRPSLLEALENGQVHVKSATVTAVIAVQYYEDEGDGWLFDVGDDQTFFLKGQWYEHPENDGPWPSTEFEIVSTVVGSHGVGLFSHGTELEPVQEIETGDLLDELIWDQSIERVIPASLDQAAFSIQRPKRLR